MNFNPKESLKVKIFLPFLVLIFLGLVYNFIFVYSYKKILNIYVEQSLENDIKYVNEVLWTELISFEEKVEQLTKDNVLKVVMKLDLPDYGRNYFKDLIANTKVLGLVIYDINGKERFSTLNREFHLELNKNESIRIVNLKNKILALVTKPVVFDNNIVGYLVAYTHFPRIGRIEKLSRSREHGLAFGLDNEVILCSSWIREYINSISLEDSNKVSRYSFDIFYFLEKENKNYAFKKFNFKYKGAHLVGLILQEIKKIRIPLNRLLEIFIMGSLFLIVLLIFSLRSLQKKLFKPIAQLSRISQEIKEGKNIDWYSIDNFYSSHDEIHILYFNFKQMVKSLNEAIDRAEKASKMKDVFLANVSHEIRSPINAVMGVAQLLERSELSLEQKKYVRMIKNASQDLLRIINDILDVAKMEADGLEIKLENNNLHQLINDLAEIYHHQAENKGLRFLKDIDPAIPQWMLFDETRLKQVLMNLLSNAIKFTSKGEVKFSVSGKDKKVGDNNEVLVRFSVQDTGVGIPEDKINDIFSPFVQAYQGLNREYGGTGLGLTIANELVKRMGGDGLHCLSKEGKGSTFWFVLPMQLGKREKDWTETRKIEGAGFSKMRVLVADDSQENLEVMEDVLNILGVQEVLCVSNGQNVLDLIEQDEKRFDVLILDLEMPGVDGLTCARKLRQKEINIPIIAMTGHAFENYKKKCFESGIDYFLTKPFKIEELQAILAKVVARKTQKDSEA